MLVGLVGVDGCGWEGGLTRAVLGKRIERLGCGASVIPFVVIGGGCAALLFFWGCICALPGFRC